MTYNAIVQHPSLPQRGQRSVALKYYVVARRASTNQGTAAVSSNTETSAKY